jgi:hypothetical protein
MEAICCVRGRGDGGGLRWTSPYVPPKGLPTRADAGELNLDPRELVVLAKREVWGAAEEPLRRLERLAREVLLARLGGGLRCRCHLTGCSVRRIVSFDTCRGEALIAYGSCIFFRYGGMRP